MEYIKCSSNYDKKIESTARKGGNAGYHHFLLFLQCFQKLSSSSRSLKLRNVWQRVNFTLNIHHGGESRDFLPWIICLLVNNFFIRCCLKNLTHQANPRSPSAFSASNQIPIGHVLTELLKIFLPERGEFLQMSVILFVVVTRDSPPCS